MLNPETGPNGAAKSMSAVENSPVEVTLPCPAQSIRPLPVTVPWTSAMTPSVSRVSSSGWKAFAEADAGHVDAA